MRVETGNGDCRVTKKEATLSLLKCKSEIHYGVCVGRLYRVIPPCHRLRKRKLSVSENLRAGVAGRCGCVEGR